MIEVGWMPVRVIQLTRLAKSIVHTLDKNFFIWAAKPSHQQQPTLSSVVLASVPAV
jgi:hypothetical protein